MKAGGRSIPRQGDFRGDVRVVQRGSKNESGRSLVGHCVPESWPSGSWLKPGEGAHKRSAFALDFIGGKFPHGRSKEAKKRFLRVNGVKESPLQTIVKSSLLKPQNSKKSNEEGFQTTRKSRRQEDWKTVLRSAAASESSKEDKREEAAGRKKTMQTLVAVKGRKARVQVR